VYNRTSCNSFSWREADFKQAASKLASLLWRKKASDARRQTIVSKPFSVLSSWLNVLLKSRKAESRLHNSVVDLALRKSLRSNWRSEKPAAGPGAVCTRSRGIWLYNYLENCPAAPFKAFRGSNTALKFSNHGCSLHEKLAKLSTQYPREQSDLYHAKWNMIQLLQNKFDVSQLLIVEQRYQGKQTLVWGGRYEGEGGCHSH